MKLTNTNKGRIVISVYLPFNATMDNTAEFVYVVPAGESFDPTDIGLVSIETKESLKETEL